MPVFVHLAPEKFAARIRKNGLRSGKRGVYCMPVLRDFYASHQWLRELKRGGHRTIVGIYFKLPPEEPVSVGHYGRAHLETSAGEAVRFLLRAPDPRGYEVILRRSILPREIHRIHALPQVVGWRYEPDAHGKRPCPCPVCLPRGSIRSRRLRARLEGE